MPKRFFVEKTWDKNGLGKRNHNVIARIEAEKGSLKPTQARSLEGQLTLFLNKFSFEYVPAIKDRSYVHYLFQKLQNSLFEKGKNFRDQSKQFNELLRTETQSLFNGFKERTKIDAGFKIPDTLLDFYRTLNVDTGGGISLFERGDGIQMQFIPEILNEIWKNTSKARFNIWGFEEPENCYEPLRSFEIAQQFLEYSKEKQIFLTTHSFPFIALRGDGVSSYRVKHMGSGSRVGKIDWEKKTIKMPGADDDMAGIEKELGLLTTYVSLSKHLGFEFLKQKKQKLLFVEDEKIQIYKICWLKLNGVSFDINNFEAIFDERADFVIYPAGGRTELRKKIDQVRMEDRKDDRVVAIFDFDDAYVSEFKAL